MSNEKPKPIIIKSNKCEDTLPSPITKETDWDDTKELTNQELKEIYKCDEKKLKIQNFIPYITGHYEKNIDYNYKKNFEKFNLREPRR